MSVEEVTQKLESVAVDDNSPKTVLSDSSNFEVKHPLNSKWTLWYTKPAVDKSETWSDLLRPVTSFETVEEFWAIIQNIPEPHELPMKSDYHVFRDNIRPEWEDPANSKGGKWSFHIRSKSSDIDELWLRALLAVIGETIDEDDSQINGVVLSIRKGTSKFALWTKADDNTEALTNVGTKFKQVLKLGDEDKIEFVPHSSTGKYVQATITL
ncbi:hypothetical protein Kpol_1038p18 [Vanderwaltozyma polyspora DSM 70294]|uniref:Eukaryotic translation initiation factor 4E n=1 Tax=Vanderwaltozyma polyspora (strain ATCC 22028 / DSM 70294 / BCRC 21397 / CBS 2163 / NBRC 10782 / NRRL Y-8283 / UCD 57-17) TaxID=436907 RepID=A7TR08_VANPO|nr:uncharacterized protein Kpol_1038p18 [Vanderwaltozyma polyspora DSM 70294]EDO15311.1 hypothetical protein Kpol_1038p18 [Vanderwaltozyma polyspora DSM 70294]